MNIAFIGLGIMGNPMARNLYKSGYLQKVYNRTAKKAEFYNTTNVKVADSPAQAAEGSDMIFIMVADSQDVEDVILGKNGVYSGIDKQSIVVDMSSINPETTKSIGEKLRKKDATLIDAPVSGGEQGAVDGSLAVMVGGDSTSVSKIFPYLEKMGSKITHVGPLGSGGYAKLANQVIVAMGLQSIAEAFYLAKQSGLDFEMLYEAIHSGLAGSNVLNQKINNLIDEEYQPGFKIRLHLKDINNALKAAEEKSIKLPITEKIQFFMEDMNSLDLGDLDHSSLYEYISKYYKS